MVQLLRIAQQIEKVSHLLLRVGGVGNLVKLPGEPARLVANAVEPQGDLVLWPVGPPNRSRNRSSRAQNLASCALTGCWIATPVGIE
ncbi:hypothetical protein ABZS66_08510 [Dactylosporangium sp. NPDC005572]|uniref:hypothetical protein n=1 Tax=Dactylosporangium sp. NPDC005572 TaxID=3156889 RepID=UPI00339DD648